MENKDFPAYPNYTNGEPTTLGMSKREEFAKFAMMGLLSTMNGSANLTHEGAKTIACEAVMAADALLIELEIK